MSAIASTSSTRDGRSPPERRTRSGATSTWRRPISARRRSPHRMPEPALELEQLEVRYGTVAAVRDVTFRIEPGEIVGLIGPNGAGKSTTLHAIMGVVRAHQGDIRLHGRSIEGRSPESIARQGVALVPEGRRIFGEFTVEENLRLGLAARRKRNGSDPLDPAYELFPILREFRRRSAGALSGGQQQQLGVGRARVAGR